MAIKANIVIDQGTDFSALIDVETASDGVYDLTGFTVASQMRKTYASASPAATFGCSHNGALGQISITLANAVTNALEPGRYMYDIEITSSGGAKQRVVEGIVTVTAGMTR
jgi:hypothetical protein